MAFWKNNFKTLNSTSYVDVVDSPSSGESLVVQERDFSIFNPNATGSVKVTFRWTDGTNTAETEEVTISSRQTFRGNSRLVLDAANETFQAKVDSTPTLPLEVLYLYRLEAQ